MDIKNRKRQVRELLATATLADPTPQATLRSDSGLTESRLVPCSHCNRTGRVKRQDNPSLTRFCPLCDNGWRKRRKGDSAEAFDGVTRLPVRVALTPTREPVRVFKIDEDIRRLSGLLLKLGEEVEDGRRDLADEVFRLQRRRRQMEREGSYRELSRSLRLLSEASHCCHRAVVSRWLMDIPHRLSAHEKALEDIAVEWLARTMRGTIVVPLWAVEKSQKIQEVDLILDLREKTGWGSKRIAAALQINERKVKTALR